MILKINFFASATAWCVNNKSRKPVRDIHGLVICILLVMIIGSCRHKPHEVVPLFTLMDSSGINFQNTVVDSRDENSFYFRNFYNGGGVALGDINGDGLPDVLLTSNMGENKLYLNKGQFRFEDITAQSGMKQDSMWSTGATMADVNADGWLDIYICNSGNMKSGRRINKLYINNHNLTFTEEGAKYGLNHSGYCTQASFFDYDLDGDLDCFIINNSPIPFSSLNYAGMRDSDIDKYKVDSSLKGGGNHLFRNDNGFYREVTREAGLHSGLISFGLGNSVGDINQDGYPDIYVGNDFIEKDYLYINQKNGTFKDELEQHIQKISMSSMSSDLGDINNDGLPEIFTTDMFPADDYRLKTTGTFDNIDLYLSKQKAGLYHQYVKNCLQLNNGDGSFSEIGNISGTSSTDWSWGALFFDADNDGLNDIFICNGINKDLGDLDFLDFFSNDVYRTMLETGKKMELSEILDHIPTHALRNPVFKNDGQLHFTDQGVAWGFDKPSFSNSVAFADLDGDGDLDLVINNENQPAFVYRNNSREQNGNHYIAATLKGNGQNTFAVGSRISIYQDGNIYSREVIPSRGFQSSVDYRQVIGLGKNTAVDSMLILWPDRSVTKIVHPAIDRLHVFQQPTGSHPVSLHAFADTSALLKPVAINMESHHEDDHIDFYYERNVPEMLSREGPHMTMADVNGDGLEDLYMGGAKDQAGQLYLQNLSGTFTRKKEPVFDQYADFEDVAVLFFDADHDGDQDLFIGAGGNASAPNSRELQHRLYLNDGKGNFSIDTKAFPANSMNIAVAVPDDYDGDGDMDLFVGSRSVPYAYGVTPTSYMYQNDGSGHFIDVTEKLNPSLAHIGMVTGAVWSDVTGDGKKDLVVTGEWMATRIFSYNGKNFEEVKDTHLENMVGWWQTVNAVDVNGDGKNDLVIGNIGNNFYLHPDEKQPAKLWLGDFDQNGTTESFLTYTVGGKDMPVFLKRDITDQYPLLKKQNLKHSDYATRTITDLFGESVISRSEFRLFNYSSSIVAINNGNGSFTVTPLPVTAQVSSINAIAFVDVNGDGKKDLVTGGNCFGFPPQFGRLDASYGQVLMNDGKGTFSYVPQGKSGLKITGEVRDISVMQLKNNRYLWFIRNDSQPLLYQITQK